MSHQKSLESAILDAARGAFREAASDPALNDPCGYALYTDSDGGTVCCAVNSRAHLAGSTIAEDPEYYRWSPAEWELEGEYSHHFDAVQRQLDALLRRPMGPRETTRHRARVHEACLSALETLIVEGAFHQGAVAGAEEEHVVVFAISDDWEPTRDSAWVRRLNSASVADAYEARAFGD